MDDEEKDIYDTSIYIDYADLPKERQKALYAEFAASDPNEKKLSRLLTVVPLVFCIAVAALMLAAVVVAFVIGVGVTFIVLVLTTCAVLVGFIIVKVRLDKVKYEHELRFAAWLKTEKRVIAELKDKK